MDIIQLTVPSRCSRSILGGIVAPAADLLFCGMKCYQPTSTAPFKISHPDSNLADYSTENTPLFSNIPLVISSREISRPSSVPRDERKSARPIQD